MAKVNIRESLGRLDLLTDNKYDLRNTYDSSNLSNDKKKKLAESISKNASAKQIYNILNETFNEDGVNVTEKISDDVRDGMFGGLIGKDTEWGVFFESGPTDILDSDIEDMANDISNGRLSGKTNNGVGWQIRVRYGDDFYDYNCLNCPEDDYVGSRWEEYDESLKEDINQPWVKIGDRVKIVKNKYWTKAGDEFVGLTGTVEDYNWVGMQKNLSIKLDNPFIGKYGHREFPVTHATVAEDEVEIINDLTEDTVKQNGKWVNKGKEGTHGKFKTKKAADAQRRAIWVNWKK